MKYRMNYTLIKRKMDTGKTVYYYAIYDEETHKRIYRSTGERTKAKADLYVRELLDSGRLGIKDENFIKLKDYAKDFFIPGLCPIERHMHSRGKGLTKATMSIRRTALKEHILPHLGTMPVRGLTASIVNKWILDLPKKDKLSRTTCNGVLVTLRLVLDQAVRDEIVGENVCKNVERLGSDTKIRKAFTVEEVRAILGKEEDWDNPIVRNMCLLSAMTGMRMGEVRGLTPECITEECVIVKHSYSNVDGLKAPKNGKERIAPIPSGAYGQLTKYYMEGDRYLFSMHYKDKPISAHWVEKNLNDRMKKLGIKGKTFHSFREFFNTQMMSANINETALRAVMGHANSDMTLRYLHLEAAEFPEVRKVQKAIAGLFFA